ncbi:MAG: hypothetical protein AMK73_05980 [Planctomycetes bacterium SM23_32]|nr:MAG: hypothetical protein AMK73_05980 [Planctomycetes bacterium SM23_32]
MQIGMHEDFARRIGENLDGTLPIQALVSGAVAPNRESGWPQLHHANRQVRAIIAKCVRTARQDYLEGEPHRAAFQLGVASHYGLDNLVPYPEGAKEHAELESRFAHADHNLDYPAEVPKEVGDGRLAERSVSQLVRAATVQPVDVERRLEQAYVCLMRLAFAVTEQREPAEIIEGLADTFVGFNAQIESRLRHYRKLVQKAYAQRLHRIWDWTDARSAGTFGRASRWAVGTSAILRGRHAHCAPHIALRTWLARSRFRRSLLSALDRMLGAAESQAALQREFKALARDYQDAVSSVQRRREHWDWFQIRWTFWHEKGRAALQKALDDLAQVRAKPLDEEEAEFRKACVADVIRHWTRAWQGRLAQHCAARPWLKAALCAAPGIFLAALGAALKSAGALSGAAAAATGGAGVLVGVPYACWALSNLQEVDRVVRGALGQRGREPDRQEAASGSPPTQ